MTAPLEVMVPYFERTLSTAQIKHADVDPDLDPVRDDPRFKVAVDGRKAASRDG